MSAFVVTNETMQRCVAGIQASGLRSFLNYDPATQPQEIGELLFNLNAEAVNQRYDESDPAPAYKHKPLPMLTVIQAYKSLACLDYQCSEGDVPNHPVYKALEAAQARLAHRIVSRLPQYDTAAWD